MAFNIGALAPLQGLQQGAMQGQDQVYKEALRRLALQQAQQEQQALGLIGKTLPQIGQQDPNAGIPQQQPIGLAPQPLPQVPNATGQMAGNVPLDRLTDEIYNLESSRGADTATSSAGAVGPMQVIPSTFQQYAKPGENISDPNANRAVGGRIVGDLYNRYQGNPDLTAIAYNAGPGRADKIASGAPLSSLPGETRQYLNKMHQDLDMHLDGNATKLIKQGFPGPAVQDSTKLGMLAGREIDPVQWGRATRNDLIKAIDKADPSAPDPVKALAFLQLNKILAPEEKMQAQMWAKENQQAIQLGVANLRATTAERGQDMANQRALLTQAGAASRQQTGIEAKQQAPANVAISKYLDEHPDATAEDIQSFIQRGRSARSGPAMAAQKYLQEHPEATSDDVRNFVAQTAAQTSGTRSFDTGQQGNIVRSLNVAIDHLDTFTGTAQALKNGDLRPFNAAVQYLAKQTGAPEPTNFDGVKTIVRDELLKAVLGGAGALGDRAELDKTMDRAQSPEQLAEIVERYQQLMGGQMRGLQQQFTSSGIGSQDDFNKKLLPRTVDALKKAEASRTTGATDYSKMSNQELIDLARQQQGAQ